MEVGESVLYDLLKIKSKPIGNNFTNNVRTKFKWKYLNEFGIN